jgi:transposase
MRVHLSCAPLPSHALVFWQGESAVCFNWHGAPRTDGVINLGPLALLTPLLDRMQVANIIDRHLPPDPQLEFSHGQVLSLLLAARLSSPTALVNVADWAAHNGADILWNIPADKLNDDRLGRALDAFFRQRHSIQACVTEQILRLANVSRDHLHFDTTHLAFHGAYEDSQPRPADLPLPPETPSARFPPAHITYGRFSEGKFLQAGVSAFIDSRGALPVFAQILDGNCNGHPAIHQHFELLRRYLPPRPDVMMVSDRGTFSVAHLARLHRHGHPVLCSVPWNDYEPLFLKHRNQLQWQPASYLSIEQQRRRDCNSSLPREHYELAVLKHEFTDPDTGATIPARVIFVFSSADRKVCQQTRDRAIAKIRAGLEDIARLVQGGRLTKATDIDRRLAKIIGKKSAGRYFRWELVPLTKAERAALPPPGSGHRRALHRFVFHYDATVATDDAELDGYSILVTTTPLARSADDLFTHFKQQNYLELLHHQWKTPLAVRPVFLKSPERVEALVCLLQIALSAYQLLERLYRQGVPDDAPKTEQRTTSESLLRRFRNYGVLVYHSPVGRVVYATPLTPRQRQILNRLQLKTPAEILSDKLPPYSHPPPPR